MMIARRLPHDLGAFLADDGLWRNIGEHGFHSLSWGTLVRNFATGHFLVRLHHSTVPVELCQREGLVRLKEHIAIPTYPEDIEQSAVGISTLQSAAKRAFPGSSVVVSFGRVELGGGEITYEVDRDGEESRRGIFLRLAPELRPFAKRLRISVVGLALEVAKDISHIA